MSDCIDARLLLSSADELLRELKEVTEEATPHCDINCQCEPCLAFDCRHCVVEMLGASDGVGEEFKAARAKYQPDWNK